jgi:hypothetical protein
MGKRPMKIERLKFTAMGLFLFIAANGVLLLAQFRSSYVLLSKSKNHSLPPPKPRFVETQANASAPDHPSRVIVRPSVITDLPLNLSEPNAVRSSIADAPETERTATPTNHWAICVLTAARSGNSSYLTMALTALKNELMASVSSMPISVTVVDVSIDVDRADVQLARSQFPDFAFERLENKSWEGCSRLELSADSTDGRPPCSVRQQTRDMLAALQQCSSHTGTNPGEAEEHGWVTLLEDDTELCAGALPIITNLLQAMSSRPGLWRFATFSSYFSGASFPKAVLPAFIRHAWSGMARKPIDHLIYEAWTPEGRPYEYAGNLLRHRGRVSAFEYRNSDDFRALYDGIRFSPRQSDCQLQPTLDSALLTT